MSTIPSPIPTFSETFDFSSLPPLPSPSNKKKQDFKINKITMSDGTIIHNTHMNNKSDEQNIAEMKTIAEKLLNTKDLTPHTLPFLRQISGPAPHGGNTHDWSNMYLSHYRNVKKINKENLKTEMIGLAKFATMYGINYTSDSNKMPKRFLVKYAILVVAMNELVDRIKPKFTSKM